MQRGMLTEELVFAASTLLALHCHVPVWSTSLTLSICALTAFCVAWRRALLFPCLLMVSLARFDHNTCWHSIVCATLFILLEDVGWPTWVLFGVTRRLLGLAGLSFPTELSPLPYMACLTGLVKGPLFRQALGDAERHVISCLLAALLHHVGLWPTADVSLAALPVLALLGLGWTLAYQEASSLRHFTLLTALFVALTFVAARLLAGHWMLEWALNRLHAFRVIGSWSVVLLLLGLLLIVWAVHDHNLSASPLGFSHRKLFHALIVVIFSHAVLLSPATMWMPALKLASMAAFCVLFLVELARSFSGDNALAQTLNSWYGRWIDERDGALIATTHIQLLLGCAVPVLISQGSVPVAVCGLVSIGVGDSMAAVVGSNFGRTRWSQTNRRTIEGSAAMALSMTVAFAMLAPELSWLSSLRVSVCVALMEAVTHTRDNLLLPIFAASLLVTPH
jgi:dolichol kinase